MTQRMWLTKGIPVVCAFAAWVAQAATQATLTVSPTGSGTAFSQSAPGNLYDVRAKIRSLAGAMTGDIVVNLCGGTYSLDSTFVLRSSESGTNGHSVVIQAVSGEKPILSGGKSITTWSLFDQTKNIWKASVPSTIRFRQLYVNGNRAIRARSPNMNNENDFGPYIKTTNVDLTNKTISVPASSISQWSGLDAVELIVQPHWYQNILHFSGFTLSGSQAIVSIRSPEKDFGFGKPASYYIGNSSHFENSIDLLDTLGEWFLDAGASVVYYKPRTGESMASATVIAPYLETLISINGTAAAPVANITISDLTLSHSNWTQPTQLGMIATQAVRLLTGTQPPGALMVSHATNLLLSGNTFVMCGANGMDIPVDFKRSRITGNTFDNIAGNAIVVHSLGNRNPPDSVKCEQILIKNNRVSNFGIDYSNGIGIVCYFVNRDTIEHNDIYFGPYMGIQTGGQADASDAGMHDNLIRYNDIHHVMRLHDDGGGIYNLGRSAGMRVFENWIHDVVRSTNWAMSFPVAALYLDNYSEFITVEHNVETNCTQKTYEQTGIGAKNNTWTNNDTQDSSVKCNAGIEAENSCGPVAISSQPIRPLDAGLRAPTRYRLFSLTGKVLSERTFTSPVRFPTGAKGVYLLSVQQSSGVSKRMVNLNDATQSARVWIGPYHE
jgi:hypothetical protein